MLTQEAVDLLLNVKKHVLKEPNRLMMSGWVLRKWPGATTFSGDGLDKIPFARCGTAGCIGGWMILLHDGMSAPRPYGGYVRRATYLLFGDNVSTPPDLFYTDYWDSLKQGLKDRYREAKTQKERAEITAEAIDAFIEKQNTTQPKEEV